ncbi:hypothetical protein [Fulvivirga lutea]|uniref:Uncharacterized protein n=1 Tax=Fulvivirga lutea TaxID=2810512 RepID=A0A974WHI5_9BACT|nr:hypothetical protein [Fulvivirga lutea]QSE96215.1 hypothetical protein JR347_11390 [Fulvivirga lutea]
MKDFNKITINCNWKTTKYNEQIIDFWQRLNALPDGVNPFHRVEETVFVATNSDGEVIGVTTAVPKQIAHLNQLWFFNFRTMMHPEFRIPGLVDYLASETINLLEQDYLQGKSECVGVITLIEDQRVQKIKRKAVYTATGLTFVGYTKNKAEIRLKYFKGATI